MKKIVTGLSMLSMLALAAGCSDDNTWATGANTGKATFPLQNAPYSVAATFSLTSGATVIPMVADDEDEELEVDLAPGTWTPAMDSWTLYDLGNPVANSIDDAAAFLGFGDAAGDPLAGGTFDISPGAATTVSLRFKIGDDSVAIVNTNGSGEFILNVTPGECGTCDVGEHCVTYEGNPVCLTECETPGEDADDCSAGLGTCFSTDDDDINVCEPI